MNLVPGPRLIISDQDSCDLLVTDPSGQDSEHWFSILYFFLEEDPRPATSHNSDSQPSHKELESGNPFQLFLHSSFQTKLLSKTFCC